MCKKIVIKGNISELVMDSSLDYVVYKIEDGEEIPLCDVVILQPTSLFSFAYDVSQIKKKNELARVVVFPYKYQENLIGALFPFVEFVTEKRIRLSEIINERKTYSSSQTLEKLSKGESRLLLQLGFGLKDAEVADNLGVTKRTVSRVKQRIINKTGLISTSQLYLYGALMNITKE